MTVGAMTVGAMTVGGMIVGGMIVGAMKQGAMQRRARRGLCALLFALSLPEVAHAHGLKPAILDLHELDSGDVFVSWKPPLGEGAAASVQPILPESCRPMTA